MVLWIGNFVDFLLFIKLFASSSRREREREIMLVDCVFQLLRSELLICVYRKNFEFPVYVNYVNYWK